MIRVMPRVHLQGAWPGRWVDMPDDAATADLIDQGLLSTVDDAGRPAPAALARKRCCSHG